MINRVLIRIKAVQMVYAYYQSASKDLVKAEKEFFHSLEKSYELYHLLLLLVPSLINYAEQRMDAARNKYLATEQDKNPNRRFVDNAFARQLLQNKALIHYQNNTGVSWDASEAYIKSLYEQLIAQDFYLEYMQAESVDYEADKELWRKIFKRLLLPDTYLWEVLEEQSIYWNDDLEIVLTFVIKTIKRFKESEGAEQALLPMFKEAEDKQYASNLFRGCILHGSNYRELIEQAAKNWDLERLAAMDLMILQLALTEILEIEGIPVNVSMNEYIDLAKSYSTTKSHVFVNGILDQVVSDQRAKNLLFKP
ncbi:MAG: transcription antitermination factor NusB [Bacteroidales bacterium]|jgi:N utilization substance protein B|nr:transcription antitermination factor NusB [Bacteroidales bacterium]HKL92628.1 transcription antitermination factor NusB [Bacteroidales bacterium]